MALFQLVIIRHSYAVDATTAGGDKFRELSQIGLDRAQELAGSLKPYMPDFVGVSPAVRTRETFQCLQKSLRIDSNKVIEDPGLYHGTTDDYIGCLEGFSMDAQRIWIIGHNPMVSYLGQKLCPSFTEGFMPANALILESKSTPVSFMEGSWNLVELIK